MAIAQQTISGEAKVHNGDCYYLYPENPPLNGRVAKAEPDSKHVEDASQVNQLCTTLLTLALRNESDGVQGMIQTEIDRRDWGPGILGYLNSFWYTFSKMMRSLSWAWSTKCPPPLLRKSHLKLLRATAKGDYKEVERLIQEKFSRIRSECTIPKLIQTTALFLAIEFKDVASVRVLLRGGVDTRAKGLDNCTILHRAVSRNSPEVVEEVIKVTQNIDIKDNNGETALSANLDKEHENVLRLLLTHKANINQLGPERIPILCQAAKYGQISKVQLLLSFGANHSIKGSCGWTPLHEAVANGHLKCVEALVDAGADINAVSDPLGDGKSAGQTPLDLALLNKRQGIVNLLRDKNARTTMKESNRREIAEIFPSYARASHSRASHACEGLVSMLIGPGWGTFSRFDSGPERWHNRTLSAISSLEGHF